MESPLTYGSQAFPTPFSHRLCPVSLSPLSVHPASSPCSNPLDIVGEPRVNPLSLLSEGISGGARLGPARGAQPGGSESPPSTHQLAHQTL